MLRASRMLTVLIVAAPFPPGCSTVLHLVTS